MRDRDARAREITAAIAAVLLKEWDPIGVRSNPEARDEYDHLVAGVYRLLVSGSTEHELAEHLSGLEARMGFSTPPSKLLPVARKLLALDVRLESGSVA